MFSSAENSSGEFCQRNSAAVSPSVEFASLFGVSLRKSSNVVKSETPAFRASSVMQLRTEQALDEVVQKVDIDWFGYISIEAGRFRSGAKIRLLVCGDGNDRSPV